MTVLGTQRALFPLNMACGINVTSKRKDSTWKDTYLDFAIGAFSSKPSGEEGGRVEVMLKVAYYLGGRDGSGLIDCYRRMNEYNE